MRKLECKECGRGAGKLEEGLCATCVVGSWSPAKKAAIDHLIGVAFRGDTGRVTAATNEVVKHLGKPPAYQLESRPWMSAMKGEPSNPTT